GHRRGWSRFFLPPQRPAGRLHLLAHLPRWSRIGGPPRALRRRRFAAAPADDAGWIGPRGGCPVVATARRALGAGRLVHRAQRERGHRHQVQVSGRRELDRASRRLHPMTRSGEEQLVASQNRDGGWGAQEGRASSTEITALATLAL